MALGAFALSSLGAKSIPSGSPQTSERVTLHIVHEFEYLRYLPEGYVDDPARQWPLLLFLHGAGERGSDLEILKRHGIPKEIEHGRKLPCVVISPQCPTNERWNIFALEALVERVASEHRIDRDRIYLSGLSMGGFGVWGLALRHPERYAAILPICGGGEARYAAALRDLPVWAFHGDLDPVVALQRSQEMIDAIRAAGGSPRFTVYAGVQHDSWTQTYANPEIYEWLFAQRRRPR